MDTNSKIASMIYHGRSSREFGIYLNYPLPYSFSEEDVNFDDAPGRNGSLIRDNGARKPLTITVNFTIIKPARYDNWFDLKGDIADWIYEPSQQYDYLKFDTQSNYVWEVIPTTAPVVTEDQNSSTSGTGVFTFQAKPLLKRVDGIIWQPIPSSGIVYNTEVITSWPDWHIKGSGDYILTVNDLKYKLELEDEMYIKGFDALAYKEDGTMLNDKVEWINNDPPCLLPGENKIEFTVAPIGGSTPDGATTQGGVTVYPANADPGQIEYKPNWGRLA